MTTRFTAEATLIGGVDPAFNKSVANATRAVGRMGAGVSALGGELEQARSKARGAELRLRQLRGQLDGIPAGSRAARNLAGQIHQVERESRSAADEVRKLERRFDALGNQRRGVARLGGELKSMRGALNAVALASGAAFAGMLAGIRESTQAAREWNEIRLDVPDFGVAQARQFGEVANAVGIDAGRLAEAYNELTIRSGEFAKTGEGQFNELAAFGIDAAAIARIDDVNERVRAAVAALRQIPDAAERAAAADILAGGSGGESLRLLARDAELAERVFGELAKTPAFTDAQLKNIARTQAALGNVSKSANNLRDAFTIQMTPAIEGVTAPLASALDGLTKWTLESERGAPIIAGLAGGTAALAAGASAVAGPLASMGEQAFFIAQGGKAASAALPKLGAGFALVAQGARGAALGIKAATIASAKFIFTPVGAAITGTALAVAALTTGVIYLADKVGGFGNLASIAFAQGKLAVLSFAEAALFNFKLIAQAAEALINTLNYIPGVAIETPDLTKPFDAITRARQSAYSEYNAALRKGAQDAARQQAAGTSLGQRIGAELGFGPNRDEALRATPSAPSGLGGAAALASGASSASGGDVTNTTNFSGDIIIQLPSVTDASGFDNPETGQAIRRALAHGF